MNTFLWLGFALSFAITFYLFFRSAGHEWIHNESFSHGILIPFISAYLIWERRSDLQAIPVSSSKYGLAAILLGGMLHVMGTISGLLPVSGLALILILLGAITYVWGVERAKCVAIPICLLILMVPWPTYLWEFFTWRLKLFASFAAARILEVFGTTVFQDGNLLVLPNYVLEIKDACSGTRSMFALITFASLLAFWRPRKWSKRILLIALAPVLAVVMNIVRIVGTGLAASRFGSVAADETLHTIWGLLVFLFAVAALFAAERLLRWRSYRTEWR